MANSITGDKSCVYVYYPETKVQSSQWKTNDSTRPKKTHQSKSKMKVMHFFYSEGIMRLKFVPTRNVIKAYWNIKETLHGESRQKMGQWHPFSSL